MTRSGLPHSETPGLMRVCRYPRLIAAYHVLHRLLMPRHPLCALMRLIKTLISTIRVLPALTHSTVNSLKLLYPLYAIVKEQDQNVEF